MEILKKLKDLRLAPDSAQHTAEVTRKVATASRVDLEGRLVTSPDVGDFIIFPDPDNSRQVCESVIGKLGDDMASCLYEAHPIFNSMDDLVQARAELIHGICRIRGTHPDTTMIRDKGRGRGALLMELTTMQLVDLLNSLVNPKPAEAA